MTYYKFEVTEEGYKETGYDSNGNLESYQYIADPHSYAKRIALVIQNNQQQKDLLIARMRDKTKNASLLPYCY